jgi:sugar/nucleoside kinase (ribokinase family)
VIGLFAGLATLDLVYLAAAPPQPNRKIAALDFAMTAGGPACNAAVTFAFLGGEARLTGVLGSHPAAEIIRADLRGQGVAWTDLRPAYSASPPVSSVVVSADSGDRAVISLNAKGLRARVADLPEGLLTELAAGVDVMLVDGHQMDLARHLATMLTGQAPLVVDAGSWKPGFEAVLARATWVLCSADFHPPGCASDEATLSWLAELGVPNAAITHGEGPIVYRRQGNGGERCGRLPVPACAPRVVDTLGAGDIFHGAFCYYCREHDFVEALGRAARVASASCAGFGTRAWMRAGRRAFPGLK